MRPKLILNKRYFKVAQEMHPDKNPNADQDKFKEMTAAYTLLSNEEKRKQYDEMRKYGSPFGSSDSSNTYGQSQNPYADGFNPFGQGFKNTGNTGGRKYKTYYYSYKDADKARKDFEEFFKNRTSGFGKGQNFSGFEDFFKNIREEMEKQQKQNRTQKPGSGNQQNSQDSNKNNYEDFFRRQYEYRYTGLQLWQRFFRNFLILLV